MAKKKLNRRFAAIVVISAVSVCGAGALTYFVLVQRVRPAQHRSAGMAALEKGDYKTAFNQLGPVLPRFVGDADFLRALYRSETHMTSLRPELYGHSRTLLENITTARPDDLDAMKEKLRVDLDFVDRAGIEQLQTGFTDHLRDVAGRTLKREPANVDALRADAVARVAPYFDPAAAPASADVRATLDALAASLKAAPDEPDLVVRYAQAAVKLRDALVREHAAEPGPNDPQTKALADDVERRIDALDAIAADAGRPADRRAVAAYRVAQAEETCRPLIASPDPTRPTPAEEASVRRAGAALSRVVELATAKDVPVMYLAARRAQAAALARQNKADEGERLLREAVDALPNQWAPRIALAQFLADRGKPADAVEVLSAKLEPSTDLVGLDGVVFVNESYGVPLQRALARVTGLNALPADKREAEIAAAEEDYKIASARVPEADARMLMTRASIQDARRDRTGAIQTLNRALTAAGDGQTKLKILSQIVSLNLAIGQTGPAEDALMQGYQLSKSPLMLLQLIPLAARNGHPDTARQLLAQAHERPDLAGNPALAAIDLQFAPDAQTRKQLLDKYPENTPQTAMVKLRLAAEGGDLAAARQVGDRAAKAYPNDAGVMVGYADLLLRAGDRAAAVPLLQAAQKLKPDDKQIAYLLANSTATSTTQQAEIRDQYVDENVTDPYRRALIEAEKARQGGNEADYVAKLEAADALDKAGDGTAAERLFLRALAAGKSDEAQKWLDRVAAGQRDPAQVRALRVRLMISKGDLDAAQAAADQLVNDVPTFATGQLVRGLALLARNRPDDALKALDAALASEPGNVETIRVAISVADRLNQPATFKRLLDQGLALAPRDPQFIDAALRYESRFGDPSKTIDARTRLRDANPNDPAGWLNLAQAYADSAAKAGDAKTADGYRAKALATAIEAAGKFPNEPAVLLAAARARDAGGDRKGADSLAGRLAAEQAFAAEPQVQAQLGTYYAERGQNAEAIAAYERLIAIGKAADDVKFRVAQLKAATNDAAGATAALDAMSKPTPQARELRVNLMLEANQLPEAQKYADAQLAAERSTSNLLLSAFLKARAGDLAGARSLADEAVKASPDDTAARLARVRFALAGPPAPDNARLIEDLQAIKASDKYNVDARLLLVDRLDVAGRPDDARSELESIVADNRGQPQATARLIGLLLNDRPVPTNRIDNLLADARGVAGPKDPGLLNLEAGVALAIGDNARATKAAIAAAAAAPATDVDARRRLYATLLRTGDAASLLAEVDKRKDADASAYWHHVARGIALHRLKRDADAGPEFERALGLAQSLVDDAPVDEVAATYAAEYGASSAAQWLEAKMPEGPRRQAAIVAAYESRQEHDAAAKAGDGLLAKVDGLSPQARAQALSNLGTSNLAATPPRANEARAAFEKLSSLDPQNFMTLNNLAYAMTLEGSNATPEQAVDAAKRAYDALNARGVTGEARAYVGDTYGWTLVRAGRIDEGVSILQQARQVRELPEIDYHLGEASIARKQGAAALESLQNALEKVRNAKQNHAAVDPALEGRVTDAIRRAQALQ